MRRLQAFWVAALCGQFLLSCVPSRGGWDLRALAEQWPAIEDYSGHRLGDLVPFPVLVDDRVQLVACRFGPGASVPVQSLPGAVLGGRKERVERATQAFSRRVPGLDLYWVGEAEEAARPGQPVIWLGDASERRQGALGETQSECDVATDARGAATGRLLRAVVRIGSQTTDNMGRPREATEAEWLGALMHEFGHAAGFIGHVSSGPSLMVREESTLRRWGQRVLDRPVLELQIGAGDGEGRGDVEPTLAALYSIAAGSVLGDRGILEEARTELLRVSNLQEALAERGIQRLETVSMAGDRDARIEWRYSDGSRLGIWFRGWGTALRAGGLLGLELDRKTRRALIAAGL